MMKRRWKKGHAGEQDFELNLASIIDCFTVLVAFLLISTSFVSISILDAEVAAGGAETVEDQTSTNLMVELKADKSMLVYLSGQMNRAHKITPKPGQDEWNYDGLADQLALLKGESPNVHSAIVLADNKVQYSDVVKSMEITRLAVPSVNLGGF